MSLQHESTPPARTRFAPSPTGYLHLGALRTALFAWLWARHTGGQFILRIEDTDQNRYQADSLDDMKRSLRWLGLDWDEGPDVEGPYGPYVQSERKATYAVYAQQLIDSGHAYPCYCTPERLDAMRQAQQQAGLPGGYDRHCRYLSPEERAEKEAAGLPRVVRLAIPEEGSTTFTDLIRGPITTDNRQLQDAVLLKSDGMPTYHLAVVVDDLLMRITHVLRGQEWLASAPLHQLIADGLGIELPVLVHLPVILDPSGKGKMSKRKKIVDGREYLAQVYEFMAAGYLPDAMFNFLTNVGWNFDKEREIFTRQEAIARFNLEQINPSPAALPYDKLEWMNGLYIREMDPQALKPLVIPYLAAAYGMAEADLAQDARLDILIPLIQERIKRLDEAPEWLDWAFKPADAIVYDDLGLLIGRKLDAAQSADLLERCAGLLADLAPFHSEPIQESLRAAAEAWGVSAGSLFGPLRGAVSGKKVSPPLFESMEALGRDETLARIERAVGALRGR